MPLDPSDGAMAKAGCESERVEAPLPISQDEEGLEGDRRAPALMFSDHYSVSISMSHDRCASATAAKSALASGSCTNTVLPPSRVISNSPA